MKKKAKEQIKENWISGKAEEEAEEPSGTCIIKFWDQ